MPQNKKGVSIKGRIERLLKGLEDRRSVLDRLDRQDWSLPPAWFPPEDGVRVIEVVGSKWKTTVAMALGACISSMTGDGVGVFTSPHLVRVNERIGMWRGDTFKEIPDRDLLRGLEAVLSRARREEVVLSYFEALFLVAMWWFDLRGCRWIVLEAGLGGRLDATNSIRNDFVVLTRLEREHWQILGGDLQSIAREKLAVVKDGTRRVYVFRQFDEGFYLRALPRRDVEARFLEVEGPIGLAREVVRDIMGEDPPQVDVFVPGRLERIDLGRVQVLLDVAHTPDSVGFVLSRLKGERWSLLCAFARDKDLEGIGKAILGFVYRLDRLVLVEMGDGRFADWREMMGRIAGSFPVPVWLVRRGDLPSVLEGAFGNRVAVLGSHALVGEVKRWLSS